ncbi:MAG: ribonuclease R [Bdellovibrionaceae bacterium]|nr:ribonuclease R [Pseudobdellovibrionaceae bacterium]
MLKKKFIQGLVKRHPDGFGFLIPEQMDHPDVFIPRHSMTGVMTNDRVMAEVEAEKGGERFRGEVVRIISRGTTQVVGQFQRLNDKWGIIKDESLSWGQDLRVKMEDSLGATAGQLVAAQILTYPEESGSFVGKITVIIGRVQEPMNDITRVIMSQQIPSEFPPEVLAEAKKLPAEPQISDFSNRRDLRSKNLITIDGQTAKDFDDAVLVEPEADGFRLFVAIADVSHYVQVGTALDKEAYLRGTSVYFPNFVVPMLPEAISNGLCSLMPNVPRLCLVSEMKFNFEGEMKSSEFYEGVMESKARVTYGEAQEVIDGSPVDRLKHVKQNILKAADLARILMAKRFREGSLDLEIPETTLEIDAAGVPLDVIRSARLFAHRLIEELMLAANVAVAQFFMKRDVPAIYRVHDSPHAAALSQLEKYLKNFGSKVVFDSGKLQKRLTKALKEFEGKPEAQVLNILTLRSMNQAKYHMTNIGHFGLGFDDYTHFTSPIRRYPDLIVHRLVKNQVMPKSRYRLLSEDDLITSGVHLSACEQRAAKAERQLMSIKKARFMEKHVGEKFQGLISSVVRFGVFVLLREFDIDGLIRIEELSPEKLEFDEDNLKLIARRSGLSFQVGDALEIVVESVDIDLGQITFALANKVKPVSKNKNKNSFRRTERPRRDDKKSSRTEVPRPKSVSNSEKPKKPTLVELLQKRIEQNSKTSAPRKNEHTGQRKTEHLAQKKEKSLGAGSASKSPGKNPEERGKTKNNRRRVRKTRFSGARKKT